MNLRNISWSVTAGPVGLIMMTRIERPRQASSQGNCSFLGVEDYVVVKNFLVRTALIKQREREIAAPAEVPVLIGTM